MDAITRERDDALAELAQMKNSQTLAQKGVRAEDTDYVMFKIAALMKEDSKLDFEKAATKFLKENPRFATSGSGSYRVKTGTESSGAGQFWKPEQQRLHQRCHPQKSGSQLTKLWRNNHMKKYFNLQLFETDAQILDRSGAESLIPEDRAAEIIQGAIAQSAVLSMGRRLANMTAAQTRPPCSGCSAYRLLRERRHRSEEDHQTGMGQEDHHRRGDRGHRSHPRGSSGRR